MFYAQRKVVKNGAGQTPTNYYYETHNEAEKQYYLLCSNAIDNKEDRDMVSVEYGTVEHGVIERKAWIFPQPVPEPEAEEE